VASHDDGTDGTTSDANHGAPADARRRGWRSFREWAVVLLSAAVVATVLRTYVVQQFYIAGPSMETTLWGDDRVLVNKLAYRFGEPSRGDVIVFDRITTNGGEVQHDDLIKRVIGLPGETVELRSCDVYVDGALLDEPWLPADLKDASIDPAARCGAADIEPTRVGDDQVYLIGDNRPMSFDSRAFGPVDVSMIVGQAMVVIWPPQDFQRL
jgi:signal peptidase I